jgi:hypothetical protein
VIFVKIGDSLLNVLDLRVVGISIMRLSVDINESTFFLEIIDLFFLSTEPIDKPISLFLCLKEGDSGLVIPQLLLIKSLLLSIRISFAFVKLSDESAFISFLTDNLILGCGFLSTARFIAGLEVRDESDEEIITLRRCVLILS